MLFYTINQLNQFKSKFNENNVTKIDIKLYVYK